MSDDRSECPPTSTKYNVDNKFTITMTNIDKTLQGKTDTNPEPELGPHILLGPKPKSPEHCSETENGELNICVSEIGESSMAKKVDI